jgi:hypothetical protein
MLNTGLQILVSGSLPKSSLVRDIVCLGQGAELLSLTSSGVTSAPGT